MKPQKLFSKVKNKDADAVNMLVGRYGTGLYKRLMDRLHDKTLADEAFRKTVISFFDTLSSLDGGDLAEGLLFRTADEVCAGMTDAEKCTPCAEVNDEPSADSTSPVEEGMASELEHQPAERVGRPKPNIYIVIMAVLVLLLTLGVIWVLAGDAMVRGILPSADLGYSWFNANIYPAFAI